MSIRRALRKLITNFFFSGFRTNVCLKYTKVLFLATLSLLIAFTAFTMPIAQEAQIPADRLGEALALVGFTRDDLGHRPQRMPHKLPFLSDLRAAPMRVYRFTKFMAMAVEDHLSPEGLENDQHALFRLVYFLGFDRKLTGFRGFSIKLDPQVEEYAPLVHAIKRIYADSCRKWNRDARKELKTQVAKIDISIQRPLAALVLNVLEAYLWRQRAIRNVAHEKLYHVFNLRGLVRTSTYDVLAINNVARDLDKISLYYAGKKAVQAADDARRAFAYLLDNTSLDLKNVHFNFLTPIGRIVLAGTGNDTHDYTDTAVLVDLGGNDRYTGPVGATTSLELPISIAVDLAGNDLYEYLGGKYPAQGAGILGAGVLIDNSGDDIYRAKSHAQGYGFFGLGLLFDREGDDEYTMELSGQGAGYFGLGFHFDGSGNDRFYIHGNGQGFGGPGGGVGVLANFSGDDHYIAEACPDKTGRPSGHSKGRIAVSMAQGVGAGRRGDLTDGHSWAGGLGVLIDLKGNDTYEAGNWSLGTGFWHGTGLVYDGEGDDIYRSVYFTQGSSAHFALGALIDAGGNDQHILYETAGAGLAFGWNHAVALLINQGGNDIYEAQIYSMGRADIRSIALLIDIGGDDIYIYCPRTAGRGAAPFREGFRRPRSGLNFYANSFGLLLDIGGTDQYLDRERGSNERTPSPIARDNHIWQNPDPESPNFGYNNFGVGMDIPDGTVPDLSIYWRNE